MVERRAECRASISISTDSTLPVTIQLRLCCNFVKSNAFTPGWRCERAPYSALIGLQPRRSVAVPQTPRPAFAQVSACQGQSEAATADSGSVPTPERVWALAKRLFRILNSEQDFAVALRLGDFTQPRALTIYGEIRALAVSVWNET
jgi:hypothetical protein